MKERPILFSTEMIKAILDGRKTMTRRVVDFTRCKPFVNHSAWPYAKKLDDGTWMWSDAPDFHYPAGYMKDGVKCPYGQVGDRLWVRETWHQDTGLAGNAIHYKTDGGNYTWKPSIHMPRWASRITLEITNTRVERVQDITGKDVIGEGVQYPVSQERHPLLRLTGKHPPCAYLPPGLLKDIKVTQDMWLRAHFAGLWDDLNYNRGYTWESNSWVWVIEFKWVKD